MRLRNGDREIDTSKDTKSMGLHGKLNKVVLAYNGGLDTSVIVQWLRCEPFDTYLRTHDFLHTTNLFEIMNQIFRPGRDVYNLGLIELVDELKAIREAMGEHMNV